MPNDSDRNEQLMDLWQNQEREGIQMSVEEIRSKAKSFSRRVAWRNAREYVAALWVIGFFCFSFARTQDLFTRVGFVLIIAGAVYVVAHLYVRGSRRQLPEDLGLAASAQFHRTELCRQRDLLAGVWRWYLGPLIPGLLVLIVAVGRANPKNIEHFGWMSAGYAIVAAILFLFIGRLNQRGARRLQQRIDELDALADDPA